MKVISKEKAVFSALQYCIRAAKHLEEVQFMGKYLDKQLLADARSALADVFRAYGRDVPEE